MEMGMDMDIEDDLFFADLNKQISLLIMDDDDYQDPLAHTSSASLQVFSRAMYPATQPQFSYHQTCTRESKGTGVFIPQSSISHQRRRNRQAKHSSSSNSKYNKQQNTNEYSRGMINYSQGSYLNNVPPHNSFNTKKHVEYR